MKYQNKIFVFIIVVNIIYPIHSNAQGWEWQNPLPTGNSMKCLDFIDNLTGWFGFSGGTVLHTSDGGNTWEIQYTGIDGFWCQSIDFIDHQEGWIVGNPDGGPSYLIHTIDGGHNWTILHIDSLHNLSFVKFKDQKHGFMGTSRGGYIYYTEDGGESWEIVREGNHYDKLTSIVFLDKDQGWAEGEYMPLLYTDDGGRSWRPDSTISYGNKVFFTDSKHGWICGWEKLYRTTDGGRTWLDDLPKIAEKKSLTDIFFTNDKSGWIVIRESGTYATIDGGWTWKRVSRGYGPILFFTPSLGWIGFSRTVDGGNTLDPQMKGFTLRAISDVDFIDKNIGWVVGWDGVVAKTSDGGNIWRVQFTVSDIRLRGVFALDERRVWAVGGDGVILRTRDGGETWDRKDYKFSGYDTHWAVTFTDSLNGWIVGGGILHTEDGGETWEEPTPSVIPIWRFRDVFFINETTGWAVSGDWVYHTTDGGATWVHKILYHPGGGGLYSICFIDEKTGWACGQDWIIHTTDGGENWETQSDNEGIWPDDIYFIDENNGWVCGSVGYIFSTSDGGVTWQKQYSGTHQFLNAVDFIDKDTGWICGNDGTILHTPASEKKEEKCPSLYNTDDFTLFSNYPNPFNSYTVIAYELKKKGAVMLSIYDLLGREINVLVDQVQVPGKYWIIWNGDDTDGINMPSGMYFYKYLFGNVCLETGKMVLVR